MAPISRVRKTVICVSLWLLQALVVSCVGQAQSQLPDDPQAPYAPGRILVKYLPGALANALPDGAEEFDLQPSGVSCGSIRIFEVRPGAELKAVALYAQDPAVEFAEPDYLIFAAGAPGRVRSAEEVETPEPADPVAPATNDPLLAQQWALAKIGAEQAWETAGGSGITIAILDSGVDLDHPELESKVLAGHDFVNGNEVADDDFGHGTQVAGVAAAAANNGIGIAGLAWGANILPVKVLDDRGRGRSSNLTCAIYWAAQQGAHVANISIISYGQSLGMQSAIKHAVSEGMLIFAAAGNLFEEGNPVTYPAALDGVIAVAASDQEDGHAWFSSAGGFVDVAAPGVRIFSPFPPNHNEYRSVYGTSLASPHAAALAALILSTAPALPPETVESIIKESAVDVGAPGRDDESGHGRIDAAAALELTLSKLPRRLYLPSARFPSPTPTPTPTAAATDTAEPTPTPTATATPAETPAPASTPTPTTSE